GPPGGGAAGAKPTRDGWVPIGETASTTIVDDVGAGGVGGAPGGGAGVPQGPPGGKGGLGGMPPPGGGGLGPLGGGGAKAAKADGPMKRTEFVLLFIWREPAVAQQAPVANADE